MKLLRHWKGLPREVVELLPLEVFEKHVEVALRNMVGVSLSLNLVILEVSSNLNDGMTL